MDDGAVLGTRALNRALLARQHLLARTNGPVVDLVEHLVGMQAQEPQEPYVGVWSRLRDFAPEDLSGLLERRRAVRTLLSAPTSSRRACVSRRSSPTATRRARYASAGPKRRRRH